MVVKVLFGGIIPYRGIHENLDQHNTRNVVAVDGWFAKDHQLRLFLVDNSFQQFGNSQGSRIFGRFDEDGAVGTQSQRSAQLLLGGGRADGDDDDFSRNTLLFQAYGFFQGDFAERVHLHLDVSEVDAGVVRFDANLDVIVDHSFDWHQNFHGLPFIVCEDATAAGGIASKFLCASSINLFVTTASIIRLSRGV